MDNIGTYTIKDIMNILNIGRNSAYNLIKSAPFPVKTIRKQIRIPKRTFDEWLHQTNA